LLTGLEAIPCTAVSTFPVNADVLDPAVDVLQLPDVAKVLDLSVTRVHQLLRDNQIIAVRRNKVPAVPALFLDETERRVVRLLPSVIVVLLDGGYKPTEILNWLFAEDDSLPGRPVDVLRTQQAREIVRRAQAMAF
jgi:hypothetical protein